MAQEATQLICRTETPIETNLPSPVFSPDAGAEQRLAKSLAKLFEAAEDGIFRSGALPRRDFERVSEAGYLLPIVKGWYCVTSSLMPAGAELWQGRYWPFLRQYLSSRFGDQYRLGVESSLLVHAGLLRLPEEITVLTARADGNRLDMLHGCSLIAYKERGELPPGQLTEHGVWIIPLADALARAPIDFFRTHTQEAVALLLTFDDADALADAMVERRAPAFSGRIIAALSRLGRAELADHLRRRTKAARQTLEEIDPFSNSLPDMAKSQDRKPIFSRLRLIWAERRKELLRALAGKQLPNPKNEQGRLLIDVLSAPIDGVSDSSPVAGLVRGAMAQVLAGENPGEVLRQAMPHWHEALVETYVSDGMYEREEISGYRSKQIYLRNSQQIPLPPSAVPDGMECLFDLISSEPDATVRNILAESLLWMIQPYLVGNDLLAKFMNAVLSFAP